MSDESVSRPALGAAAALSIGAGFVHAAVIGHHTEHEQLALLFVAAAIFQVGWGILALWRPSRLLAVIGAAGNAVAFATWLTSRMTGISFIDGLETKEAVDVTDTITAGLGLAAAIAALAVLVPRVVPMRVLSLAPAAVLATAFTIPAVVTTATDAHVHSEAEAHAHGEEATADEHAEGEDAAAHEHAEGEEDAAHEHAEGEDAATHEHADGEEEAMHENADGTSEDAAAHEHAEEGAGVDANGTAHGTAGHDHSTMWPRAWDPTQPVDLSGVDGVTKKQQAYATALVAETMRDLPHFADPATAAAEGYRSIGDERTGFEHYINYSYIGDGNMLDSSKPESIVYKVDGEKRTVASAMYIAEAGEYPFGSKALDKLMGGLVTWHNHDNLCWKVGPDGPKVVTVTDAHGGTCPEGTIHAGGEAGMVHVWITPHECGVFSALEGHGAGQQFENGEERVDQCATGHDHGSESSDGHNALANWPRPYDPDEPIDLSGVEGVTAEQEAFGTQLIKDTQRDLPLYADQADALADGYFSIGDAVTGEEHLVKPQYFADGKMLDPTAPESLVYRAEGDKRTLAGAMFTAEPEYDVGSAKLNSLLGPLATWHVHSDVCFKDGRVAGLAPEGKTCPEGTVASAAELPMVHVWIAPHPCGPFAALEGIGAGQVADNEGIRVDQCLAAEHGDHGDSGQQAFRPWPREYDPAKPIDLADVEGVTAEQEKFGSQLIKDTLRTMPAKYADYRTAEADGYISIGDGATGEEHFVKGSLIDDGKMLDPSAPETIMYSVDRETGERTLSGAMFIAEQPEYVLGTKKLDSVLGGLAAWHVHTDVCFSASDDGGVKVSGLVDKDGACPEGQFKASDDLPMVHVWVVPHPCGPFAALEGIGAGQVADDEATRIDQCNAAEHGH